MTDAPSDDASSSPAVSTGDAELRSGTRTPLLVLAISLAVLFGVAAAVLGVLAAGNDDGAGGSDSLRSAAGAVGEALLTYDFNDPDAHRDGVLALATGSFRGEYEDAFDQGLAQLITEVQATSRGFVKEVYVSEIDEERAEAVVVADVERDGAGGPRTLFDIYVLLTFVRVDGEWKVDQVTDLNFAEAGADPGATATPTTAPAATPPSTSAAP
ncbi:MAG: hypothetical protein Q8K58_12545 [Acidimicrobiales bacterium]|nr:hypothetical protein [Acidimicrobiales bacterium]